jgi:NIPSNAP
MANLRGTGLLPDSSEGWEDDALFERGVGITDVVKRPTRWASEISASEFDYGREQLEDKIKALSAPARSRSCRSCIHRRRHNRPRATEREQVSMTAVVEIRTYKLLPGSGAAFHRTVVEESVPMLQRWGVDVVAFGPSLDDDDSYYLIRSYASLEERQRSQDAFYGSDEWRRGPREAVVSRIESDSSVVLPASSLLPRRY